jgi:sulfatase modifying factor 1
MITKINPQKIFDLVENNCEKTAIIKLVTKLNKIIEYINKKEEFAASGNNTSRITPNPEKGSVKKLFKLYNLNPEDYIYGRLIEDLELLLEREQANGENPKQDNPVPSLDDSFLTNIKICVLDSNSPFKTSLLKKINKLQNGLTTDKEDLEIEMVSVKGNNKVDDFMIGKYPVTQKQWQRVMGENPSYFNGDNHPVEQVSWDDVQVFIQKLNKMTGKQFRLPSEAEWEYAARGGAKSKNYLYSGSNNLDEVGWYFGNSGSKTHPVGQKKANELGLYDMSGNVWEWCSDDWYDYRVIRGGCQKSAAWNCRHPANQRIGTAYRFNFVGFRLAI